MPKKKSTRKVISKAVGVESVSFQEARQLLEKEGFARFVIVQRDPKDLRRILSFHFTEAG